MGRADCTYLRHTTGWCENDTGGVQHMMCQRTGL